MDKYLFRRYVLFIISLFINAFGIAFITKASLGTSPITSVTYVASMFTPLTMGQWTIIFNISFLIFERMLMTKEDMKKDKRMYLMQIPITLFFGLFIDCSMNMLYWLAPVAYLNKVVSLLAGCVILAIGIALEVKANAAMVAGEFFVYTIARRFRTEFGYTKLGFDIAMVVMACALSLVFMSGIYGVREGTVVAAIIVGPIVHFLTPYYSFLDKWINSGKETTDKAAVPAHSSHTVIAIAREYGSGGHQLGEMLSKELGIRLYDNEFIHMAAQKSGMDEQYIRENEQRLPSFWLKCVFPQGGRTLDKSLSPEDILFVAESKIIQELAEKEPCIIMGRCGDFVLQHNPGIIKVFCYSDEASAVKRCTEDYGIPADKAEAEIRSINQNRKTHYEFYTGTKWGDPHHYHLMLNTGSMDMQTACSLIAGLYKARTGKNSSK